MLRSPNGTACGIAALLVAVLAAACSSDKKETAAGPGDEEAPDEGSAAAASTGAPARPADAAAQVDEPQLSADAEERQDGEGESDLVKQAKEAARRTDFATALTLCKKALEETPNEQDATIMCAIAACNLKLEAEARGFIGAIESNSRKSMATQICRRQGLLSDK